MEYFLVKIILILAFFATLITGALWSGEKLRELREYWEGDETQQDSEKDN